MHRALCHCLTKDDFGEIDHVASLISLSIFHTNVCRKTIWVGIVLGRNPIETDVMLIIVCDVNGVYLLKFGYKSFRSFYTNN